MPTLIIRTWIFKVRGYLLMPAQVSMFTIFGMLTIYLVYEMIVLRVVHIPGLFHFAALDNSLKLGH
jgi:hypothetical protein